jgi:intracellular septation protein
VATGVAIVATFMQIGWVWFRHRKVDTMLWVSLAVVTVFGGATLWLHDETFIKWKPTVLYWLFGAALLVSSLLGKNLIRALMEEQLKLPDAVWRQLNAAWVSFFTLMGCANLFVAYRFPTDTWVSFKLFGGMGAMLVFVLLQGLFLSKYIDEEKS